MAYTGPQGTPAALSTSIHSAVVRVRSRSATRALSSSRWRERRPAELNRGSSGSPGRPMAVQKAVSSRPAGPAMFT
jgi:hypothetical protein